jgi:tRNA threonylcarbamoyladenosine biosynthesis protein TsaE
MKHCLSIDTEANMLALGGHIAKAIRQQHICGLTLYLKGQLGAGKTTFCRGLLRALGHTGSVKSPSYGLVEPYHIAGMDIYHIDLYRLHHAREIEALGISDYLTTEAICLIEWPEKGDPYLPVASLYCTIELLPEGNRACYLEAKDVKGEALLTTLMPP